MAATQQALLMASDNAVTVPEACEADPYYSCGPTNDPYWSNVVLMLHMDGTDGATTFVDSSPAARTIAAFSSAQVDTANKKFGTGSGYFPTGTNSYLTTGDGYDMPGDFTVEFWLRLDTVTRAGQILFALTSPSSLNHFYIVAQTNGTASSIGVAVGSATINDLTYDLVVNTWYHIAVVRSGSTVTLFKNGVERGTTTTTFSPLSTRVGQVGYEVGTGNSLYGYIDDLRITKGVARYTGNFNIPTAAFPDALETIPSPDIPSRRLWTPSNLIQTVAAHASLCYGNGVFVVGDITSVNATAQFSSDGKNWTISTTVISSSGYAMRVAFGNGIFFADINATQAATSLDGDTWVSHTKTSFVATMIPAYGNGYFFLGHGSSNTTQYTADGITYFAGGTTPGSGYASIGGAYGGGVYVLIGASGACYSSNLTTWTQATASGWTQKKQVAYGNGKFIAVGSSSAHSTYHYSTDGITWTLGTLPATSDWSAVIYSNGIWFVTAVNANYVAWSEDGVSWSLVGEENNLSSINGANWIAADGVGVYVAIRQSVSVPNAEIGVATSVGYPRTVLSLHAEDTDDSSCYQPKTVTLAGSAAVSTTEKKFDTASFSVANAGTSTANGVVITDHMDFDFGTGDFTIEMWAYRTANTYYGTLFYGTYGGEFSLIVAPTTGLVVLNYRSSGGAQANIATGVVFPLTTWQHVVVQRRGTNFEFYLNGVLGNTTAITGGASSTVNSSGDFYLGRTNASSALTWAGYIDEVRITKGVARYTAAFTPPAQPNCDSVVPGSTVSVPGTSPLTGMSVTVRQQTIGDQNGAVALSGVSATVNAGGLFSDSVTSSKTVALLGRSVTVSRGSLAVPKYPNLTSSNRSYFIITSPTAASLTVTFRPDGTWSAVDGEGATRFSGTWIDTAQTAYDIESISHLYRVLVVNIFVGYAPYYSYPTTPFTLSSDFVFVAQNLTYGTTVNFDFQITITPTSANPRYGEAYYYGTHRFNTAIELAG